MPWCWKRNAKTESTSSSGTKAEIPSESTAATCRTSSQHVLLLSAPVSESCQIPDVGEVAPNLLERHFKTNQPNRKWVTDVTEFKVNDQKLYLSPILDLFNGEVVSYNLSRHPNFKQITDMLEGAFQKLPDKVDNLILHSDQGWQYQMKSYQNLLKAKGITQSMSRKATCLDNAVAENFFGLLKTELFYLEKFDSIDQLEKAIVDYIDYYNNRRIKLKLNGLSPVQYRIQTVGAA